MKPESSRRFPVPWTVDEAAESFCIREANGQALAYFILKISTAAA
jgi:hypothetical protein